MASGPSIQHVREIFRKTNISNPPPPDTHTYVRVWGVGGLEMLVFQKI